MKFIVLGTSDFTLVCTQVLLEQGIEVKAIISLPAELRQLDSVNVQAFALDKKIAYHEFADLSAPEAIQTLSEYRPDYIFSSWPHMLKAPTLRIPKHFVIGSHPAPLPYNRGRHPLYWAFCLGYEQVPISFFVVDEKVDNGPILAQVPFLIPHDEDISAAFQNMCVAARVGMAEVITKLRDPHFVMVPQDGSEANMWRKRTLHDVILDPRLSSRLIIRTVRSFAPPYPGAVLIYKDHVLRVARAQVDDLNLTGEQLQRLEQGRIYRIKGRTLHLKTDDHLVSIELTQDPPEDLLKAKLIHPPTYYLQQNPLLLG